jgi:hypothetical protein
MLDQIAVKEIADAGGQELDRKLDVFVLQLRILHLVFAACCEHVVGEEVNVADWVLEVVCNSGLQHLHHLDFFVSFLKQLDLGDVTKQYHVTLFLVIDNLCLFEHE